VAIALAIAGSASSVAAGGFYVPEIGPRASAMGGAMTARSADPSAIFHNPAGLAGQRGNQVQLSLNLFLPQISFFRRPVADENSPTGEAIRFGEVENTNAVLPAPYLGASSDLGSDELAVGLAVYAPFGSAIEYPDSGSQRHVVTAVDLRAIHVSAAAAYRVSERVRLGASLNYVVASLSLAQRNAIQYVNGDPEIFPDPDPALEGDTLLEGSDPFSLTATLGALYSDASGRFDLGISVMTPTTLEFEGDADIRNAAITPLMDAAGAVLQDGGQRHDRIRTEIPLPLIARLGAVLRPTHRSSVALDLNWQRWSSFDALTIDFEGEYELLPTPGVYLYDVTIENDWRDTLSVRLGSELQPIAERPLWLRAGVLYDQSPIADERFDLIAPDSDKLGLGGGASYATTVMDRELTIDLAYQHLFLAERDVVDSDKTILNKPASSFYSGVTRAAFDIVVVATSMRF
jgi:long-chain fatty acid transport protein